MRSRNRVCAINTVEILTIETYGRGERTIAVPVADRDVGDGMRRTMKLQDGWRFRFHSVEVVTLPGGKKARGEPESATGNFYVSSTPLSREDFLMNHPPAEKWVAIAISNQPPSEAGLILDRFGLAHIVRVHDFAVRPSETVMDRYVGDEGWEEIPIPVYSTRKAEEGRRR